MTGVLLKKQFNKKYYKAVLSNDLETMKNMEAKKIQFMVNGIDTSKFDYELFIKKVTQKTSQETSKTTNETTKDTVMKQNDD